MNTLRTWFLRILQLFTRRRASGGQSLPEYALTILLIAILAHGTLGIISRNIVNSLTVLTDALAGNPPSGNPPSGNPPSGNPPSGNPPQSTPTTGAPAPTATRTNTPVATATRTNTPAPTATHTNTPMPTATRTNTPMPTATHTPTATAVPQCQVPNFYDVRINSAQSVWSGAGFTTNITRGSGSGNFRIRNQSLSAGSMRPCNATITLSS